LDHGKLKLRTEIRNREGRRKTKKEAGALMLIAFNTVQLLQCKTPIFLSGLWPQNGPELNSSDDEISGATQQQQHELWLTILNKLSQ